MFEGFLKIDKSMCESRFAQILGFILLVGIIIFGVVYKLN
jgi:hypothetical protein